MVLLANPDLSILFLERGGERDSKRQVDFERNIRIDFLNMANFRMLSIHMNFTYKLFKIYVIISVCENLAVQNDIIFVAFLDVITSSTCNIRNSKKNADI